MASQARQWLPERNSSTSGISKRSVASQILSYPADNFRRLVDHCKQQACCPLRLPKSLLPIAKCSRCQQKLSGELILRKPCLCPNRCDVDNRRLRKSNSARGLVTVYERRSLAHGRNQPPPGCGSFGFWNIRCVTSGISLFTVQVHTIDVLGEKPTDIPVGAFHIQLIRETQLTKRPNGWSSTSETADSGRRAKAPVTGAQGTAGTRPSRCRCAPASGRPPALGGSRSCRPSPGNGLTR